MIVLAAGDAAFRGRPRGLDRARHERQNHMAKIHLKRAYEKSARSDGLRILVERLWPRGLSKERASVDVWLKNIAPSPTLRRWFGHDPAKWEEFQKRYWAELDANPDVVAELRRSVREGPVAFVYAARDEQHNGALALWEYLKHHSS